MWVRRRACNEALQCLCVHCFYSPALFLDGHLRLPGGGDNCLHHPGNEHRENADRQGEIGSCVAHCCGVQQALGRSLPRLCCGKLMCHTAHGAAENGCVREVCEWARAAWPLWAQPMRPGAALTSTRGAKQARHTSASTSASCRTARQRQRTLRERKEPCVLAARLHKPGVCLEQALCPAAPGVCSPARCRCACEGPVACCCQPERG